MNKTTMRAVPALTSCQKRALSLHPSKNGTAAQQRDALSFAKAVKPLTEAEKQQLKEMGLL